MPLTPQEKQYIIDSVVEVLKAPDKKERIARIREKVMASAQTEPESTRRLDEAIYAVLQAVDELYG